MGKYINGEYIYSLEDCDCIYCLHYDNEKGVCRIETCCCLEEKAAALGRQRKKKKVTQKWVA